MLIKSRANRPFSYILFYKKVYKQIGGSHGILLTPLHYTNKAHFESSRTDITWDEAKETGLYSYVHGDLRPNKIHNDWTQCRERCGLIANKEYCNNCLGKIDFNKKEYKQQLINLEWNTEPTE